MIKNYFKIAFRSLLRHKRMTSINVAGLGIGMAATVLIALWVQNELGFDKYHPDAKDIYRINAKLSISKSETWLWENSQYILGDFAVREIPEITAITRLKPNTYTDLNLHDGTRIISEKNSAYVDESWFKLFHYDFISGSVDAFNKNPHSLILTASTAKKYFGNQGAVGKVLRIDSNNYQVQAVVKDNPANSSFQYNVLIPLAAELTTPEQKRQSLQWGNYNYITFLKLRPGANTAGVADKLLKILLANKKNGKNNAAFYLVNLKDIHFESNIMNTVFIHGNRTVVNVFIVLAVLLLTTACINYVNLTTARASLRSKEVSVRKIVGAGRIHLFGQFMSESLVVSLLALVLALILVQVSMPWFRQFTGKEFEAPLAQPMVWLIIGATLGVSFLLNGLYPALLLSSFKPMSVFRGRAVLNFKDAGLRRLLVVLQFTISVVLIVGTLVIYSQLQYMQKIDLGYDKTEVFSFSFPWWTIPKVDFNKTDALMETAKHQLKERSATEKVAMAATGIVNFDSRSSGNYDWAGRPKDFNPAFARMEADPDFQQIMHIEIAEGRWFNHDKPDQHNVVLNQTAVKLMNLKRPLIGQRIIHNGDTGVLVGVVKDFHYASLHDKIGPMIISNGNGAGFYIKTTAANTAAAIASAQKVWRNFFPDAPFAYTFLDESYNNLYKTEQQSAVLITLFAVIAIVISALGLLGLAAFAAEQKVKEIGIRKVLGASLQHIVGLLSADFLKMVLIASLIAFPIAWWAMNKWLQDFAYRINLSWWIFLAAGSIALIIALVTISFQAVKAALANPVNSLRSE